MVSLRLKTEPENVVRPRYPPSLLFPWWKTLIMVLCIRAHTQRQLSLYLAVLLVADLCDLRFPQRARKVGVLRTALV